MTGPTGPAGSGGGGGAGGSIVVISSYTGPTGLLIANVVPQSNSTPVVIWSNVLPSTVTGHAGVLSVFFNLYSQTPFGTTAVFDYGLYIDGTALSFGESNTAHYAQTVTSYYAMSSNGYMLGTNGITGLFPINLPLYVPPAASVIQIALANSSSVLSPVQSIGPGYATNNLTSSGTSNTSSYVPQTAFVTAGSNQYIVPSTVSTGAVTGVYIYCWGAGAGHIYIGAGSGGFASAFYSVSPGTVLSTVVGGVATGAIVTGGGGTQATYMGAGGFSGVFLGVSLTQAAALVIAGGGAAGTNSDAGGGGGGGSVDSNATGTGYDGQRGYNWTAASFNGSPGGTLAAGGVGPNGTGSALLGASGNAVACGGGGYFGGGAGNNGGSGGGGGSSYISNVCTSRVFSPGSYCTSAGVTSVPCGSNTNTYYVSNTYTYGYGGSGGSNASPYYQGLVVIVPAVGTNPTYVGVTAKMLVT